MILTPDEKLALLKLEFPTLNLDSDDDVERYFELRKSGAHQAALQIYNSRLRRKFPNETTRILLLRYYRANDPRYHVLLTQHLHQMADHFAVKVQNALFCLTHDVESLDVSDAYAVIKTIEKIITMLAPDRDMAPAAAEKFVTYAEKIRYRQELMRKTADLVRQYVAESLDSVENLRQSIELRKREQAVAAERAAVDARIRAKENAAVQLRDQQSKKSSENRLRNTVAQKAIPQKSIFDLSTITFSPEDIARIEIPSTITRLEDKVLAYSLRYWPVVSDATFERTIFLYSKKYATKNYDIYDTIKIGRAQQRRDGDILTSVLGVLATGYFYSVQGDRYLQVMWRRLHSGTNAPVATAPTVEAIALTDFTAPKEPEKVSERFPKAHKVTTTRRRKQQMLSVQHETKITIAKSVDQGMSVDSLVKNHKRATTKLQKKLVISSVRKVESESIGEVKTSKRVKPQAPANRSLLTVSELQKKNQAKIENLPKARFEEAIIAESPSFTCSVADMIKQLSGKSYDVYKDVFFKTVRPCIRKKLSLCRTTQRYLFDTSLNKAEEIVFLFLEENYENPFMNWAESHQKNTITTMGFLLESLDGIIALWYEKNK